MHECEEKKVKVLEDMHDQRKEQLKALQELKKTLSLCFTSFR